MIRETGHAAGPGPVQAERFSEDYHGTYAKPARPRAVPLDWHETTGRMKAAQVLALTCECRPVLPEVRSRSGGLLIRRDPLRTGSAKLGGRPPGRSDDDFLCVEAAARAYGRSSCRTRAASRVRWSRSGTLVAVREASTYSSAACSRSPARSCRYAVTAV